MFLLVVLAMFASNSIPSPSGATTYEDFTTYTEVDSNNKLTVTTTKAEGANVDWNEEVYLYKDYGANYFNAIDIDFEIYLASTSNNDCFGGIAVTNTVDDVSGFASTDIVFYAMKGPVGLWLQRGTGEALDAYAGAADTLYYCTLLRAASSDAVNAEIYSDASRETLLKTLTVSGFGTDTKYRYVFGFVNRYDGTSGYGFYGYIQNMDLKGETPAAEQPYSFIM